MSSLRNTVRLTGIPIFKKLDNGSKLVSLALDITEDYKSSNDEKKKNTNTVNLIAWNDKADFIVSRVNKGSYIAIDGRIKTRLFKDNTVTEVHIDEVLLLNKI